METYKKFPHGFFGMLIHTCCVYQDDGSSTISGGDSPSKNNTEQAHKFQKKSSLPTPHQTPFPKRLFCLSRI